eukprot:s5396_g4.t1
MDCGAIHQCDDDTAKLKLSLKLHRTYERCKRKWEQELLIDASKPELGSWLTGKWDEEKLQFSLICSTCVAKYGRTDCVWTTGKSEMQLCHARKHQVSWAHKAAVANFSGDPEPEPTSRAGLRQALEKVWRDTAKGGNFSSMSGDATGSRAKCARMTDALGRACKFEDQALVRQAYTLALHQDARHGVLCVRFSASSLNCQHIGRGVLGFCHNFGTKTEHIVTAVHEIIMDFCIGRDGTMDSDLYDHICQSVELLDSDGASDEQKAIRLLADVLFPHARFIVRDSTHSARRLTRSPWSADPYFSELMETYITGGASIVMTILHSPDLRSQWCGFVAGDQDAEVNTIRFLGCSKDRFDSTTVPLSRFVVAFDSVWQTALHILETRKDKEIRQRANDFLRYTSVENLLQLALLADAATEALEVIRFHDTETFDISHVPAVLERFLHRLDILFIRGEAPLLGHTRTMLQMLETERTCVLRPEKIVKSLGGPGSVKTDIIQRCLQRMAAYVKLVSARLDLEFPSWRPLANFVVFDLTTVVLANRRQESIAQAKINIKKLAEIFNIDADALLEQFLLLRANALHYLESGKCSESVEAWKLARGHLEDRRMRNRYKVDEIDQLLSRFMIFCGNTTSGVEQTFSVTTRCIGDYRKKMTPEMQNLLFRVLLTPVCAKVIETAANLYGEFRMEKQNQRWKVPRLLTDVPGQEATYLRKRKREVDQAGFRCIFIALAVCEAYEPRGAADIVQEAELIADDAWSEGHDQEMKKMKAQGRNFLLDAVNRNVIPEEEIDLGLLAEAKKRKQTQVQNAKQTLNNLMKPSHRLKNPKVVIDAAKVQIIEEETVPSIAFDYYVVDQLDNDVLDNDLLFLCSLFGKAIVNPSYILSEGKEGTAMAFRAANSVRRQDDEVWRVSHNIFNAQQFREFVSVLDLERCAYGGHARDGA